MTGTGAAFRLEPSPYGNKAKRADWAARIEAGTTSLRDGVAMLLEWRADHGDDTVTDQDDLFIEAQLEARVAVLRFDEMTNDQVRNETLTDEKVADVCQAALAEAEDNVGDPDKLEEIVAGFRNRYRPPIMPSSPFMRAETELAEILMRTRELDWYGQTLDELRDTRGVVVHKAGKKKKGVAS
jgi:methane monooxygenase component A gamma chain